MVITGNELAIANHEYSCARCPLNAALSGEPIRIRPGTHGGDDDLITRELGAKAITEPGQRELARRVRHQVGYGNPAADGRDIDDPPASLMSHVRQHREHQEERTPEVGLHRIVVVRQLHVVQRTDLDDSGVVDQDVDAAVVLDRLRDGAFDILALANIRWHDQHLGGRLPVVDIVRGPPEFVLVASDERDARAFSGELPCEHESEPARSAGDDNRFAAEVEGTPSSLRAESDR